MFCDIPDDLNILGLIAIDITYQKQLDKINFLAPDRTIFLLPTTMIGKFILYDYVESVMTF